MGLLLKKATVTTKMIKRKTLKTLRSLLKVEKPYLNKLTTQKKELVSYILCKLFVKTFRKISIKFYYFFRFFFFRSPLKRGYAKGGSCVSYMPLRQSLNDYFFSPSFYSKLNKNSRWKSMEEIINHFLFYSEGPKLPAGFSQGSVEAPKGHLGVSIVSHGGNKGTRIRIRSSIQVMAGQITSLVQGVSLGDFVVIVSGSNIVVGEIDR